jgi:DNA-binding transcriptional MocR family regulator
MGNSTLALLLRDWQSETGPRYHKLALAVMRAVERGDLVAGDRLPPERELASELGVSRTTIVSAYAQLREWKVAQSRRGGGSYVVGSSGSVHQAPGRFAVQRAHTRPSDQIVLGGYLSPSFERVRASLDGVLREKRAEIPYGIDSMNNPELQQAVTEYYSSSGTVSRPEQVTATTGVMQGIYLVISELLSPGDRVLVATPTLMGVTDALRRAGVIAAHAEIGSGKWRRLLDSAQTRIKLAILSSCVGHPGGGRLSAELLGEIETKLCRRGVAVLDVLPFFDLRINDDRRWQGLTSKTDNVITIGSGLRVLYPGLSIGWIRSSKSLAQRFLRARSVIDDGPSWIAQSAVAGMLGEVDTARREWTALHRPKLARMAGLLEEKCPRWHFEYPDGGATIWVTLPEPKAAALAEAALSEGVTITPGPVYGLDGEFADRVALSFSVGDEDIDAGIDRLAVAAERLGVA